MDGCCISSTFMGRWCRRGEVSGDGRVALEVAKREVPAKCRMGTRGEEMIGGGIMLANITTGLIISMAK